MKRRDGTGLAEDRSDEMVYLTFQCLFITAKSLNITPVKRLDLNIWFIINIYELERVFKSSHSFP